MEGSVDKVNLYLKSAGLRMEPEELDTRGQGYFESRERQLTPSPLTDRVQSLSFFRPGSITVLDPKIAKLLDKEGEEAGGFLAVSHPGKGEVVVLGAWSVIGWIDPRIAKDSDNLRCLRNMLTKPVE